MKEGRGTGRVGPAVSWGGSGLSSPSSPPGQRRHWRAAAAFPFVSPTPLLSLSLHPTLVFQHPSVILCFSSLLLRPPPPLAPKLSPSSHKQSALPLPPLLPPLSLSPFFSPSSRRVSLWGRPRPPSPAPPGLLMPRPLGKSLGQAAHSRPRPSWPGPSSSSCLQRDFPHGSLSPCPLRECRGARGDEDQRSPLSPPFATSSNTGSRDAARRDVPRRVTARRWRPEWGGPEGSNKGHQSEGSAQRGAGSAPEGLILEGSNPRGIHEAATWRGCCLERGSAGRDAALPRCIPEDFSQAG